MNVIVTGAAGFLGRRLITALLRQGLNSPAGLTTQVTSLRAVDTVTPDPPFSDDPRVATIIGDLGEPDFTRSLIDAQTDAVFHLAAVVSREAEQNFELGMRINLDATRNLLDACRQYPQPIRFIFASSVAVYGGTLPPVVLDDTPPKPSNSYGAQKLACEILINEYSRKGFIDGRALRLPTIIVRPGKPNPAASSFASSIVREPLQGHEAVCPVPETTGLWVLSPNRAIAAILHATNLSHDDWGNDRSLMLPGLCVTVNDLLATVQDLGGNAARARIQFALDPEIQRIVGGWPQRFSTLRAEALGFSADASVEAIVHAFVEDELGGKIA